MLWLKTKCSHGDVEVELDIDIITAKKILRRNKMLRGMVVSCSHHNPCFCSDWLLRGCLLYQYFTGKEFYSFRNRNKK